MNIVRGFLTDPDVLFMDEPTLGLDVNAAREVRQLIKHWVECDTSRTLLLTTHYMVEADELCDRVAIINKGRVLACDTPSNLKRALRKEAIFHLEVTPGMVDCLDKYESINGVKRISHIVHDGFSKLELSILERDEVIGSFINALTENHLDITNLQKREPTLEDVFVELVGRSIEVRAALPCPNLLPRAQEETPARR